MKKKTLHWAITILKFILGISLLIALLTWGDNAERLLLLISSIKPKDVFVLCLVSLALNLISCLKWRLFLTERGFGVSLSRLLALYFVGKFFSNFVPTMVGGDLTRTYLLGRQINSQSQSFASVFLERVTGLAALIILAILFSVLNPHLLQEPKIGFAIVSISLVFILSIAVLLHQGFIAWLKKKMGYLSVISLILEKASKVQRDILYFKGKYHLLAAAMVYSFAFHLLTCINVYAACIAINVYPSFLDIAVITPVILLLNLLPVSPNNIGWWEWTFSFLLVEAGTGSAEGLAVGLLLRAITLLFSLIGGLVFLLEKGSKQETWENASPGADC